MSVDVMARPVTPEDLLKMPNGDSYELVNGEVVERDMGWKTSWIGGRLMHFLATFLDIHALGWVAPGDASYQCFPDQPNKVRKPDVSFIKRGRIPANALPDGHCRIAPDMAAEVISPNESYENVEEKVGEYLSAGVQLVWVIIPATRSVRIHRANGTVTDLKENDELDGENVLPGFRCRVGDLFVMPGSAPQPD